MRIAIVGINYAPEPTGIPVYTSGMAEYLAHHGHHVTVYTGFPYYPYWEKFPQDKRTIFRQQRINDVEIRRHYVYVPHNPSPLQRILHEASFVASVSIGYAVGSKSDVTIIVSPPLLLGLPIALLARFKRSRTILHVQDLQPDAAVDLGMLRSATLIRILYRIERATYRLVDRVSTISHGMLSRIRAKGTPGEKLLLLRNWANDDVVKPLSRSTSYRRDWSLGDKFVVLYSGNMGVKQGLDLVLDAATTLRTNSGIEFVLVGDGGERDKLAAIARQRRLPNVQFRPLQPMERLAELFATADLAVIPQRPGVKDIVLPSKLANILASGRPVIAAASSDTEFGAVIRESGGGLLIEPGDSQALACRIVELSQDPTACANMGQNGRQYMRERLTAAAILDEFQQYLNALPQTDQ